MTPNKSYWRLLLPLGYMTGLFLLSSIADTDSPSWLLEEALLLLPPTWQNLLHIPLYFGLAACWIWALSAFSQSPRSRVLMGVLFAMAWGIFDEFHQSTVPGRFGSITDMGLNLIGAALAAALIYRLTAMKTKPGAGRTPPT